MGIFLLVCLAVLGLCFTAAILGSAAWLLGIGPWMSCVELALVALVAIATYFQFRAEASAFLTAKHRSD